MMDDSVSPNLESQLKPTQTHESKKRKLAEKIVVSVKVEKNGGKLKNEGAPSDLWSWRKYGQKPIKGSPYPRGYYRCSTSKGCSAKKQVERSKTDASMVIITYTSTHNHPGPDLVSTRANHTDDKIYVPEVSQPSSDEEGHFHYLQSPLRFPQNVVTDQEETHETLVLLLDEEPLSCPRTTISSSGTKSDENDFFDDLEELPICSAFTSFMRSNKFLDEGIHVFPS